MQLHISSTDWSSLVYLLIKVHSSELTCKLPSGLHITAALQHIEDGAHASILPHLHLVFVVLEDDVAQCPRGGTLHLLVVILEEGQELHNPMEIEYLGIRIDY